MDSELKNKAVEPVKQTIDKVSSNEVVETGTNDDVLAKEVNRKFKDDFKRIVNETNGFQTSWLKLAIVMSKLTKKLLG